LLYQSKNRLGQKEGEENQTTGCQNNVFKQSKKENRREEGSIEEYLFEAKELYDRKNIFLHQLTVFEKLFWIY